MALPKKRVTKRRTPAKTTRAGKKTGPNRRKFNAVHVGKKVGCTVTLGKCRTTYLKKGTARGTGQPLEFFYVVDRRGHKRDPRSVPRAQVYKWFKDNYPGIFAYMQRHEIAARRIAKERRVAARRAKKRQGNR